MRQLLRSSTCLLGAVVLAIACEKTPTTSSEAPTQPRTPAPTNAADAGVQIVAPGASLQNASPEAGTPSTFFCRQDPWVSDDGRWRECLTNQTRCVAGDEQTCIDNEMGRLGCPSAPYEASHACFERADAVCEKIKEQNGLDSNDFCMPKLIKSSICRESFKNWTSCIHDDKSLAECKKREPACFEAIEKCEQEHKDREARIFKHTCFQREEADCLEYDMFPQAMLAPGEVNGRYLFCAPTMDECEQFRTAEVRTRHLVGTCASRKLDEVPADNVVRQPVPAAPK
jgi:hypothetical protein